MRLFYLSADNLRNSQLIRELVFHFKNAGPSIILHDHFGTVADTRFVTKRISSMMSEEMIVNNAISGDQRGLLYLQERKLGLRTDLLKERLLSMDLLIMNALAKSGQTTIQAEIDDSLHLLLGAIAIEETIIFAKNPLSPLVAKRRILASVSDRDELKAAYEEEESVLSFAEKLFPVVLASPSNFWKKDH